MLTKWPSKSFCSKPLNKKIPFMKPEFHEGEDGKWRKRGPY